MADSLHLKVVLEALDKASGPINDILRSSKGLQRAYIANACIQETQDRAARYQRIAQGPHPSIYRFAQLK
ncbi:hypothetical protein [Thermomonas sp.]|uniref:hypothetical protein n=1 Tax=Thermomonas sp. TaxID=1971895 RepID=UPI0035B0B1E9